MTVNAVTLTGITIKSRTDILTSLVATFNGIYGTALDSADSSNPDVQWLNAISQAAVDNLDLQAQGFNSMDPDLAIGFVLDQRVAYNGIQRLGGTFTIQNISVTVSDQINESLIGFNADPANCFTVSDNFGNQWQLIDTQSPVVAGVYVYAFRAALPGAVTSAINTIQTQVSVVVGVTGVNNPTNYTSLGLTQETDAKLRVRRQKSAALPSQGFHDGLVAALENINGITSAQVGENDDDIPDAQGIPAHSIWAIVAGVPVGGNKLIAQAIYLKRGAGCGMKGSVTYNYLQADLTIKVIKWDVVTPETIDIQLHLASLDGITPPNTAAIKAGLVSGPNQFLPRAGAEVNITQISSLVQAIDPNTYVVPTVGDGFSKTGGVPFFNVLSPTAANFQFTFYAWNIHLL